MKYIYEGSIIFKQFIVPDLVIDASRVKVLLILESPHTNEYKLKHPVAEKAGKSLCKEFTKRGYLSHFDNSKALGCEILKHSYTSLSVMNASSIPMDQGFYPVCSSESEQELATKLGKIKKRLQKRTHKNYTPNTKEEQYLVNDFRDRFNDYFRKPELDNLIIVPCGHFAKNFIQTINVGSARVIEDLDHPSSRKWSESVLASSLWRHLSKDTLP